MSAPSSPEPVFCAIVDKAYFLGAVALVNSLRLTGNGGDIAFLDVGLDADQRTFLEQEARVHDGPARVGWLSVFAKPLLGLMYPERVAVLLDNDLVITGSLDPLVRAATEGSIAVFQQPGQGRWFPEWQRLFSLKSPLRPGRYVNGACVALSTRRWRSLLERWRELGEIVAAQRASRPFLLRQEEVVVDPMGYNEQDTLNALLMSEVPESAVRHWPHHRSPWWEERHEVEVVDVRSLRCRMNGEEPFFLHATGQPKPWQRWGWLKLRFPAFNRLLVRVLAGDDVPLRIPVEQLPPWLRPGLRGRLLEHAGAAVARGAYATIAITPTHLRTRVVGAARTRLSHTGATDDRLSLRGDVDVETETGPADRP